MTKTLSRNLITHEFSRRVWQNEPLAPPRGPLMFSLSLPTGGGKATSWRGPGPRASACYEVDKDNSQSRTPHPGPLNENRNFMMWSHWNFQVAAKVSRNLEPFVISKHTHTHTYVDTARKNIKANMKPLTAVMLSLRTGTRRFGK